MRQLATEAAGWLTPPARRVPNGAHIERRTAGQGRRSGGGPAGRRLGPASAASDADLRRHGRIDRSRQCPHGPQWREGYGAQFPLSRRDRRIFRRCHRREEPGRDHHQLEPRRAAAFWLCGRRSYRRVDHHSHTARTPERGARHPRTHSQRRTGRPLRDQAPAQGRDPGGHFAYRFPRQGCHRPHHRRFQDRPRHHRDEKRSRGTGCPLS